MCGFHKEGINGRILSFGCDYYVNIIANLSSRNWKFDSIFNGF
jgi:hypothetical protein